DGLQPGQRAERVDVVLLVQEVPEPLGAEAREGVLLLDRAADPDDVLRRVGPLDPLPPGVGLPLSLQLFGCALEATVAHRHALPCRPLGACHRLCPGGRPVMNSRVTEEMRNFRYAEAVTSLRPEEPLNLTSDLDLVTFGQRLRHLRRARGLTLSELGERVGRAPSQLSLLENGRREP